MHFYQMRFDFSSDLSAGFPAVMDKWDSFCGGVTPSREGATRGRGPRTLCCMPRGVNSHLLLLPLPNGCTRVNQGCKVEVVKKKKKKIPKQKKKLNSTKDCSSVDPLCVLQGWTLLFLSIIDAARWHCTLKMYGSIHNNVQSKWRVNINWSFFMQAQFFKRPFWKCSQKCLHFLKNLGVISMTAVPLMVH